MTIDDDYIKNLKGPIKQYVYLCTEVCSCLKIIKTIDDIYKYFDDDKPKKELYEIALTDERLFSLIYEKSNYSLYYQPDNVINTYIKIVKTIDLESRSFLFSNISSINQIYNYFNETGITKEFIELTFRISELFDSVDNSLYKDYYVLCSNWSWLLFCSNGWNIWRINSGWILKDILGISWHISSILFCNLFYIRIY